MTSSFASLSAKVHSPEQIGYVKFIIESYDGLAVLSTANPERGEILLRCHPGQVEELLALLSALRIRYDMSPDRPC